MQKLSGISLGKNNKSCGIFHREPNKIGFAFFYFPMIFYAIYKKQESNFTIWVILSQWGPWKDSFFCNVVPGRPAAAGRPKSGGSGEGDGRERVWGGGGAHLGSIWAGVGGGEASGGSADGGGRRLPLRPSLRRGCRPCWAILGSRGCGRGSWWWGCAQVAVRWRGGGNSPRAAMAARLQPAVLAGAARSSVKGFDHLK
jgi:hypothetical protein